MNRMTALLAMAVLIPTAAIGQGKKPQDIEVAAHWIYDDIPAAFAQAKRSSKPILALFR